MSPFSISLKSLLSKPLSSALNILLIAFGTGILTLLLLASTQIGEKLDQNSKGIDLVVGAKGSPLQLILSSIYYIDFPTGNIPLKDAIQLTKSPFVKRAVPLAQGDNYNGIRIVGTDTNFVKVYRLQLASGKFWSEDFEVTIGAQVARNENLKLGDHFYGAHGLSGSTDIHKSHAYRVVGILKSQGDVADHLILTNIPSVWKMHEDHEKEEAAEHGRPDQLDQHHEREITALLIQYRSPMSVVLFPRMVNGTTNLQAASPAMESTRLFSLIGVGVDTLKWFAVLIMLIAGISVFVNLYNSLKERSYDLAVMRILGATRKKLFMIVVLEGLLLTLAGTVAGLLLGHLTLQLIGHYQESDQARLSGTAFLPAEFMIIASGIVIGVLASVFPAIKAYQANISRILTEK